MDNTYQREAWERLGNLLQERRGQLGYGFRERGRFLLDRGGERPPSLKTIGRLERGERDSYPEDTVAKFEALYGWEPGSFAAVLKGGEPSPRGEVSGRAPGASVTAVPGMVTAGGVTALQALSGREIDLLGDEEEIFWSIVALTKRMGGPLEYEDAARLFEQMRALTRHRRHAV